jgi:hypothetical protein
MRPPRWREFRLGTGEELDSTDARGMRGLPATDEAPFLLTEDGLRIER